MQSSKLLIKWNKINLFPVLRDFFYLLHFFIFDKPFSAKPHITDPHILKTPRLSAGGSLVVIRVNGLMVPNKGLEPLRLSTWT